MQCNATDTLYTLPDGDGLGLAVSPGGGKAWHLRYHWLGKQKRISLGNYPRVSLREARALRDEARALLDKDINPHTERKRGIEKCRAFKFSASVSHALLALVWNQKL